MEDAKNAGVKEEEMPNCCLMQARYRSGLIKAFHDYDDFGETIDHRYKLGSIEKIGYTAGCSLLFNEYMMGDDSGK